MDFSASFKRTRIAPTPSGFLHLGNVLSFVITIGLAKKTGAAVLLRIDDMDRERYQDEYVQDIFDVLQFMELPYDEGPRSLDDFKKKFSQIHRLPDYQKSLEYLAEKGKVFACTCSRSIVRGNYTGTCVGKKNDLHEPGVNWRLDTGELTMPYFVVRKKDGMPAYQLTSIIDDLYFEVDLVVRGEDLRPSTEAQLFLAQHLPANKFHKTIFFHHPLLTDNEGKKLSKTAGSISIQHLIKQGKSKEAIFQLIAHSAGLPENDIYDWQSLAAAYFEKA